jgi:hypothetical protein
MFVKIKVGRHLQLVPLFDWDWLGAFSDGGNRFAQLDGLVALPVAHARSHAALAVGGVLSLGQARRLAIEEQLYTIASIMQMTLFADVSLVIMQQATYEC